LAVPHRHLPAHDHRSGRIATVEHRDRGRAIGEATGPDFCLAGPNHSPAPYAKRVLIHCDHLAIGDDSLDRRGNHLRVVAGNDRRGGPRPHHIVRAILFGRQARDTNQDHVRIIPRARSGVRSIAVMIDPAIDSMRPISCDAVSTGAPQTHAARA
jgi:hypothetical protein